MKKIDRNIKLVRRFITSSGFTIQPLHPKDCKDWDLNNTTVNGGLIYKTKTIYIRRGHDPLKLFYVLLHEAGHLLAYKIGFSNIPHLAAERQAYFGGALIAASLGIDIDWAQWRLFNWEANIPYRMKR